MKIESQKSSARFDNCVVRYREPGKHDYVLVSRVILVGYPGLSDGARLTYLVIVSHDWYDPEQGRRKGYVYPTIERLAHLRQTTVRTIQRHLVELITAGLLTREIRPGRASILYIEEPRETRQFEPHVSRQPRGDKSVGGGMTKLSPSKETEKEKQTNAVNGVQEEIREQGGRERGKWTSVGEVLGHLPPCSSATSAESWIANQIALATGDQRSLGCFRTIAIRCPADLVFEALALLKEARRDGLRCRRPGALFVDIVRRLCRERGRPDPLPGRAVSLDPPDRQAVTPAVNFGPGC